MEYNLKDKIEVTEEFLEALIAKNWQEVEAIQQQIANIDTTTKLGSELAKMLKNTCTNYYVLIGCLENLAESQDTEFELTKADTEPALYASEPEAADEPEVYSEPEILQVNGSEPNADFEPFEYFVDFDEPIGEPVSDQELYG
jgi:hypothetical protein